MNSLVKNCFARNRQKCDEVMDEEFYSSSLEPRKMITEVIPLHSWARMLPHAVGRQNNAKTPLELGTGSGIEMLKKNATVKMKSGGRRHGVLAKPRTMLVWRAGLGTSGLWSVLRPTSKWDLVRSCSCGGLSG